MGTNRIKILNNRLVKNVYGQEKYIPNLIDKFNLAPIYKIECDKDEYISIMKSDKKVSNSKIRLVLPISKGEVKIFDNIKEDEIKKVL